MGKLFNSKKGMTMLEVLIAIALLSLVSVPLIVSFMNSLMISRLSKNQIEVNAVTRTVKELVSDGFYNNQTLNNFDIDKDGDIDEHHIDVNGDGIVGDHYRDLLCVSGSVLPATYGGALISNTPDLNVPDSDYKFTIHYDSANYHNPAYDETRNVLITIYNKDHKVVNKLKITVRLPA